jgi:outer membrane lipoprotein SlyB
MRKRLLSAILSEGLLFATTGTSFAVTRQQYYHHYRSNSRARARYIRHKRHVNTAKRVGIGAAGGAAIGALAGGGKGAAIGGIAGAGAGLLYDNHQKNHGHN